MVTVEQYLQYAEYLVYLFFAIVVMGAFYFNNKIKQSVGWNFINTMAQIKMPGSKDLALRVKSPAGKEYYIPVTHQPLIKYKFKENGKEVEKLVLYDIKAVDYLNGIPILNVTPLDIRPLNKDLGTIVNMPPEVIQKLVTDSTKDPKIQEMKDKNLRILIYGLVGMGVVFIIGITYINQTNAELQTELAKCAIELGRSVTVIGGN